MVFNLVIFTCLVGGGVEPTLSVDVIDGLRLYCVANDKDLQNRAEYIKKIAKKMPILLQYSYIHKNILLRLDKCLTPEQAAEYEKALNSL